MSAATGPAHSIWIHPTDVASEGADAVFAAVKAMGLGAISLAATYHAGRFLLPHDPKSSVKLLEDGVAWYRPDAARWKGQRLQPKEAAEGDGKDLARAARDAAAKAGLAVNAWVVALHNSRLGEAHPDCTIRNAFGDPYPWALCPSHADVRQYAATLAADVAAQLEPAALELESFGFMGYTHQSHHDKAGVKLDGAHEFLLSVCFCDACAKRMAARKVDAAGVAARARTLVKAHLDRGGAPAGAPSMRAEEIGPWLAKEVGALEMANLMSARRETVVSLIGEVRKRVPRSVALHAMAHPSPFVTGAAIGGGLLALGEWVDAFILNLFRADVAQVRADVKSARSAATPATRFLANLRAFAPDSDSAAAFQQKAAAALEEGAVALRVYHYGLMPRAHFDWVKPALAAAPRKTGAEGR
jgi:hypothetical protein